jgi:TonB dependent receptor/Carboxypeptidase regulatory-like domain
MPGVSRSISSRFPAHSNALRMIGAPIRHVDHGSVFCRIIAAWMVLCGTPGQAVTQSQPQPAGLVRGVVLDAATGVPLARVLVAQEDASDVRRVVTGADGRFELEMPPGPRRLRVSVVGYALTIRDVVVSRGGVEDLTITLSGGTGTHSEEVNVSAGRFRAADPGAPAQQVLGSADIQNLRGVLADDPLRAVQALPGVATGDDLRSEFSVRGSNFSHMHLSVDGFSTPYLLHAVRAVEDASSAGSIAMINSDVLQDVALVSGGYQQRSGNRTGASVEFNVRAGGRERPRVRAAVSGTSASAVVEGPLGRARRGSWLASARQSYLDLVIDRLVEDQVQFGFSDAQAKLVYDLSSSQRVETSILAGRSRLKEPEEDVDANDLYAGYNASVVGMTTWRWSGTRTVLSAGVLIGSNRFRNETIGGVQLDRGRERQITTRVDVRRQIASPLEVEAGAEVDALRESRHRQRPEAATTYRVVNDYAGSATRSGAYGIVRWTPHSAVSLLPGVRVDYWSLTRQSTTSPWMQVNWRLGGGTLVRGATGLYQQFPHFEQVIGAWGTDGLDGEKAAHADVGVEQSIGSSARLQVTVYDREERGILRRAGSETTVIAGRLIRGSTAARYENRLDGSSRGVEVMLQRLDSGAMSGWISYAYGRTRYHDVASGESFWGDLDQRHTMNLYGLYRLSPRTSLSGKLRVGSNFPAPGYYAEADDRYFVGGTRNDVRLPSFARLDLRANQTFAWSSRRLTLFVEVINVLNRENVRYHPPSIDGRTFEARRLFESLLPVVPSAGLLLEF